MELHQPPELSFLCPAQPFAGAKAEPPRRYERATRELVSLLTRRR
jgi:hypothetical protein